MCLFRVLCSTCLGGQSLLKVCGILRDRGNFYSPYLFTCIWAYNIYFILWVIFLYLLFFCSSCSSFGHWELFQLAFWPLYIVPSLSLFLLFFRTSLLACTLRCISSSCIFPRIPGPFYWRMIWKQRYECEVYSLLLMCHCF